MTSNSGLLPTGALDAVPVDQLSRLVRSVLTSLANRPDPAAFAALLAVSQQVGECLGVSARTLAAHGSWTQVAGVAGTTRQAAWARWRG